MATTTRTAAGESAVRVPTRRRTGGVWAEIGEFSVFSLRTVAALRRTPRDFSAIFFYAASILLRASLLLFVMSMFVGISASNVGAFLLKAIGASDYAGLIPGYVGTRFATETMFGYVFAGSICCAVAAELGAAKIQQEIDAYESQGVDPVQKLASTRLAAVILVVPFLTVISLVGFYAGSRLDLVHLVGVNNTHTFADVYFGMQKISGQLSAIAQMEAIAIPCIIVACFYGLRTTGGPDAVGQAVARSLAVNIVLVHVICAALGVVLYGSNPQIPIGGG